MSNTSDFGYGQMRPEDSASDYDVMRFITRQFIAAIATAKLVQVKAVHPGSGTPPALGTVDVQPLVSQVDGQGNASPHGTIFGIPYLRLVSGTWEIVADPAVGDVGLIVVCDRDSSAVIKQVEGGTQGSQVQAGPPGSNRKYDLADGVYLGGLVGANATNAFIELNSDGTLEISDSKGNVLQTSSSGFSLTGNVAVTGSITATQGITAGLGGGDQVTLQHHTHTQGVDSHGDVEQPTSAPTAGT